MVLDDIVNLLILSDNALKDDNNIQAQRYQSMINELVAKYNVKRTELDNLLSRYQTKYANAVEMLRDSVRGSAQFDTARRNMKESKEGIKSTQDDIQTVASRYEAANQALSTEKEHYENRGLVKGITELLGGK